VPLVWLLGSVFSSRQQDAEQLNCGMPLAGSSIVSHVTLHTAPAYALGSVQPPAKPSCGESYN
jgi:hypothetical protein